MTPSYFKDEMFKLVENAPVLDSLRASEVSTADTLDMIFEALILMLRNLSQENRAKLIASILITFDEVGNER